MSLIEAIHLRPGMEFSEVSAPGKKYKCIKSVSGRLWSRRVSGKRGRHRGFGWLDVDARFLNDAGPEINVRLTLHQSSLVRILNAADGGATTDSEVE